MKKKLAFSIAALTTIAVSALASAHHSVAGFYDLKKEVTLTGTVEEFKFVNPHSVLRFNVKQDGKDLLYRAESSPVAWLARNGWKPSMFKAGSKITVTGNPSHDAGVPMIRLLTVTFADGKTLNANSGEGVQ